MSNNITARTPLFPHAFVLKDIQNAYVSGMQKDLGLHGNQLNYITTAWTCGYVIGQIPSNLLLTRIRPSIWIPAMEVIWSVLTMSLASAKTFSTVIAIRFLVGLAESTFYPAIQYVIGSWYKPDELGKRACIFHVSVACIECFGRYVQRFLQEACGGISSSSPRTHGKFKGAYDGLNNVHGLAGWKWLFIIDGIITIPIALLGFLIMPGQSNLTDLPSNTPPSLIYSQAQIDMANRRMAEVGRKPPTHFTRKKIIGFFTTWHVYLLTLLYVLFNNGANPSMSMIFWLQSFNTPEKTVYTIGQINTYPLGINAVQVLTTLSWAWWSDAIKERWPPMVVSGIWNMITCIVLAATPLYTHIVRRWIFYYFTLVTAGMSGLILTWANELTGADSEKRSFVVASCNTFAYVMQAWLPIVIFPQVEQPRVFKGTVATAGINFAMVWTAITVRLLQRRDERRAAAELLQESASDEAVSDVKHGITVVSEEKVE
ncbi:MFS general substrate transporter [Amylocystis lapponica]|nr:MFS general substrate transporter [Amylocystis lapponica]